MAKKEVQPVFTFQVLSGDWKTDNYNFDQLADKAKQGFKIKHLGDEQVLKTVAYNSGPIGSSFKWSFLFALLSIIPACIIGACAADGNSTISAYIALGLINGAGFTGTIVGAIAGLANVHKNTQYVKEVTFYATFADGKKFIGKSSNEVYVKLLSLMLSNA